MGAASLPELELCRLDCDCLDLDQVCSAAHILLQRHPDAKLVRYYVEHREEILAETGAPRASAKELFNQIFFGGGEHILAEFAAHYGVPGFARQLVAEMRILRKKDEAAYNPQMQMFRTRFPGASLQAYLHQLKEREISEAVAKAVAVTGVATIASWEHDGVVFVPCGRHRGSKAWRETALAAAREAAAPFPIAEKQYRTKEELYRSLRHTLLWDVRDPDWFEDKLRRVQLGGYSYGCCTGRRYLMIPELDHKTKVQSTTFKDFRDPASTVSARTLHGDIVPFKVSWGMVLCTNTKVSFTTDVTEDGGVERSVAVVRKGPPLAPHERPVDTAFKSPKMAEKMAPGLCYLLFQVFKVFGDVQGPAGAGRGRAVDTMLHPQPYAVVRETQLFLNTAADVPTTEIFLRSYTIQPNSSQASAAAATAPRNANSVEVEESVSVTDLDSLALTGSATLDGLTAQGNVGCDQLLCNDVNCTDVFTTGVDASGAADVGELLQLFDSVEAKQYKQRNLDVMQAMAFKALKADVGRQEVTGDDENFVVTTDLGNEFATLGRELPEEAVHRTKRPEDRNATAVVDRGIQTLKKDVEKQPATEFRLLQDNADKFQHNKDLTDRRIKAVEGRETLLKLALPAPQGSGNAAGRLTRRPRSDSGR
ncbi:unnamed protein product [Effrenium voratum]|uniref:Uncharacterized protein n=1 Tax=Effrenium voratum TaxID=2562239 RepID=A0AA36N091_9DINO|nr:unnamed protein product [Effrenium voratum]